MEVKYGEKNSYSIKLINIDFMSFYYGTLSLGIPMVLIFSIYLIFSTRLSIESFIVFISIIIFISINYLFIKKEKYFCYNVEILSEKVKFNLITPILVRKTISVSIKDLNLVKDKESKNEFLINELKFYSNNKLFLVLTSHSKYWNSNQLYHIYNKIKNGNYI